MERKYIDDVPEDIQDLLYAGKKIDAIKRVREDLGLGLKEAKEKVEDIQAAIGTKFPGSLPEAKGCAGVLLVGLSLFGMSGYALTKLLG